jgi:hypothetical protein
MPVGKHAQAVVIGPFTTFAEAKRVKTADNCFAAFWILSSDLFASVPGGQFVVAAIGASETAARSALAASLACKPGLIGRVTSLREPAK